MEKSVLKPLSELSLKGPTNGLTLTHMGKKRLMENAYKKYIAEDNHLNKLEYMYSFFFHAYHLREWIQHFSGMNNFKSIWKEKYSSNSYYNICHDFWNKTKHFILTRPEISANVSLMETTFMKDQKNCIVHYLRFDNTYIEMEELMSELIKFWEDFFNKEL